MKKPALLLIFALCLCSFSSSDIDGYITLFEDGSSAKYYISGSSQYLITFANDKETINGKQYYVSYTRYSWGDIDTAYYRKGTDYYYHIDKATLQESIALPIAPKAGDKWFEADKSWSYEVTDVGQKFKTPKKKYKDCVKVSCKQLTNRDKEKSQEYILYYSPKYGFVGNVNSKGKILGYLKEVKLNAKEGEKIGGK